MTWTAMCLQTRSVPYTPVLILLMVDCQDSIREAERLLETSWPGLHQGQVHCWEVFHLDKKSSSTHLEETLTSAGAVQLQGEY